jgi:hypothetical protein
MLPVPLMVCVGLIAPHREKTNKGEKKMSTWVVSKHHIDLLVSAAVGLRGKGCLLPGRIGDIEGLRSPSVEAGGEAFGWLAVDLDDSFVE